MPFHTQGLGLASPPERSGFGAGLQDLGIRMQGRDPEAEQAEQQARQAAQNQEQRRQIAQRLQLFETGLAATVAAARGRMPKADVERQLLRLEEVMAPLGIIPKGSLIKAIRTNPESISLLRDLMEDADTSKTETEVVLKTLQFRPEQLGRTLVRVLKDIAKRRAQLQKEDARASGTLALEEIQQQHTRGELTDAQVRTAAAGQLNKGIIGVPEIKARFPALFKTLTPKQEVFKNLPKAIQESIIIKSRFKDQLIAEINNRRKTARAGKEIKGAKMPNTDFMTTEELTSLLNADASLTASFGALIEMLGKN